MDRGGQVRLMQVVFSAMAKRDLSAILDHIGADHPDRALTFVRELQDRCVELANFPARFPLAIPRLAIRKRVYRDYLIFYVVTEEEVAIVRILNGATDYGRLL